MGTIYESIESRPALRFERRIAHPPHAVWNAIADPDELPRWFPTMVAGDLRAGGHLTFTFEEHDLPPMEGDITAFDPPRRLAFYWGDDHLDFELARAEGGEQTDLRFTVLLDTADKAARDGAGWHTCLDALEKVLGTADEQAIRAAHDGWRQHYDEYVRRGFPAAAPLPHASA
jgi:uncharacterized protein YndB with AHSA1/START domain